MNEDEFKLASENIPTDIANDESDDTSSRPTRRAADNSVLIRRHPRKYGHIKKYFYIHTKGKKRGSVL